MTIDASPALPGWDDISDLDKGAALLHLHKRQWEGASYAIENYPARFFDHPALTDLADEDASRHAARMYRRADDLPASEHERLYDLALAAADKRWADEHAGGAA